MNKIRVVIATNILDIGGAERTVQTLALRVDTTKFDVTVLCLVRGGPRVALLEEQGARVLIGNGTIERVRELLPHPEVDILHFHRSGERESILHEQVVEYLKPKKLMETNIFAFNDPVLGPKFDLQIYKSMMMLAERAWGGASHKLADCLRQRVVYNPVTVDYFDRFALSSDRRQELRRNLGIRPEDVVLGRVGRNDTVKWGDLILSALPLLLKINPNVKVVLRTVPTSRLSWLKRNSFFDGRVIVLPESSVEQEIAETYQLLDVYVHTSRRGEAFGNSLNEAMVWSLPIVVENTPHWDNGQLEQVEHGVTGLVVRTVGGLSAAIKDLLDHPEKRLQFGMAGRARVVAHFGAERGVRQYELAYEQLAGHASDARVLAEAFPRADDLIAYHSRYDVFKKLDVPHQFAWSWEAYRMWQYWRWRVVDALRARGFIGFLR